MCNENEWIVREAFLAYDRGDVERMMDFVDPDLQWTRVDPSLGNSQLRTDHGRRELENALRRQLDLGLRAEVEEVIAAGQHVMLVMRTPGVLVMRTPGVDEYRNQQDDDRTYDVATVRGGLIVELRACRDRGEARSLAGIG